MPVTGEAEPLEDLDLAADEYTRACAGADDPTRERLRADFVGLSLPFARRLARRYRGRGEPIDDLEQVARLGLVKSVNRYDPERGSFTAYAIVTITGELKRHFRNHAWGVHVPRRLQDLSLEVGHTRAALTVDLSRRPTEDEIAGQLGVEVAEVREAQLSGAGYAPGSLNAHAEGYDGVEVGDLIGADDPDLDLVDDRTSVERLICRLPERERRILGLRFYGNLSQAEIARDLGVSQMHVSRLLARALTWLRQAMLSDTLPPWAGLDETDHRVTVAVRFRGDVIEARVCGEIDRDNAGHLRDELLTVLHDSSRIRRLVLDLGGVPLLDAAGIGVLVAVHEAARVRGVQLRVTGLQAYVEKIVTASGLRDLIVE
ncbi:sigma-70 family RNA polymerase sigma factor [Actinoplanes sp. KI2]|uniref:sigma-70 family RNA polymerase sigma factor n=1 Tax=Actinoplanes sp. KI2 TaxID=2983315 RepID=UPI0021D5D53B|nr:sigma-70 family RNA polymerase sigma factor [Actinoplanes sp. KI2]MCU7726271.1 sigma-70 family RNA polymerase sigma factor [Actinoplanes sp. KI2]